MLRLRSGNEAIAAAWDRAQYMEMFPGWCPSLATAPLGRMRFRNWRFLKGSEGIAVVPNLADFLGARLLFK